MRMKVSLAFYLKWVLNNPLNFGNSEIFIRLITIIFCYDIKE